ncbi:Glyoxylase, beta-lactamase superfamily II [Ekhidna lutea]|uniref:Glyoxylase, beta-lactamase superfamily II n=1 Tax=Ekhidna lutea TaxID=447679 RepID=A0A239IS46_EKHLU|nr:MBL fold metallo-hydrolase [Ekhidna lutea]SNS96028.1 Glyoxylase, beta-lactamase superfamily II [Ekhidna lutea]
MKVKSFVFNPFYENTYVISSNKKNCLIFDPGCYEDYEVDELKEYIHMNDLNVVAIINTHCHIDHVLGNDVLKFEYKAPLKIPENEKEVFGAVPAYAPQWGISGYRHADVDEYLKGGSDLVLDEVVLKMIEVPGHSPGHLMFLNQEEKIMIGGDVLFRESIGRTDLPGGNHDDLLKNIQEKVYTLPDDIQVLPGHGPATTIGHEKQYNPFVKA